MPLSDSTTFPKNFEPTLHLSRFSGRNCLNTQCDSESRIVIGDTFCRSSEKVVPITFNHFVTSFFKMANVSKGSTSKVIEISNLKWTHDQERE